MKTLKEQILAMAKHNEDNATDKKSQAKALRRKAFALETSADHDYDTAQELRRLAESQPN